MPTIMTVASGCIIILLYSELSNSWKLDKTHTLAKKKNMQPPTIKIDHHVFKRICAAPERCIA